MSKSTFLSPISNLGYATRSKLAALGHAARLMVRLLGLTRPVFARFGDQIFFLGNYSLAIITVSGLFVGFVLGLQSYYALQRYGSSEAVGLLVALSLVRELGPVVTWASRSAGRIRSSLAVAALARTTPALLPVARIAVHPGDTGVRALLASIDATVARFVRSHRVSRYADLI